MAPLTPDQNSPERELLVHLSRGNLMSLYLWGELADIMSGYDEDSADDMMRAVDARLQELAYSTTLDQAFAEFDAAKHDERGLWAGRYALFDDAGGDYVLYVNDAAASLVTPDGILDEHTFSGGTLRIGDARYAFELAMILPLTDAQMDHPEFDLTAPSTPTQPRCEGTVTILRDGKTQTQKVQGKRDCFTRAGVDQIAAGDPPEQWCGVYQLVYTDKDPWTNVPDSLAVAEAGGSLKIALGARQGTQIVFANNALHCVLDAEGKSQLAGYFILTDVGNLPRFFGLLQTEEGVRSVTGYWTQRGTMAKLVPAQAHRLAVRAALADTDPNAPPETARTFPIDLTKLPKATKKVEEKDAAGKVVLRSYDLYELGTQGDGIVLLKGVETHDYAVILEFKNLAPDHPSLIKPTEGWTWTMVGASPTAELFVKLRHTSSGTYWLDSSMGETQSAGWHYFALEQVIEAGTPAVLNDDGTVKTAATSGKVCRIWLDLEGVSRKAIEIAPTELLPVIINKPYDPGVTAAGGEPPLIWTVIAGAEPLQELQKPGKPQGLQIKGIPEIRFDPSTQLFSGTLTKDEMALTVHPVKLQASSQDRVVMNPGTVVLNLRVESEISSSDQKNINVGTGGAIGGGIAGALAVLIAGGVPLVQFLHRKRKAGSRYGVAKELIKTAKDSVLPTKDVMVDTLLKNYKEHNDAQAGRDAASTAVEAIKTAATNAKSVKENALREAESAKESVSGDQKIKLEREISRLKIEIAEAGKRISDADRAKTAIDDAGTKKKDTHDAFEKHVKPMI